MTTLAMNNVIVDVVARSAYPDNGTIMLMCNLSRDDHGALPMIFEILHVLLIRSTTGYTMLLDMQVAGVVYGTVLRVHGKLALLESGTWINADSVERR